MRFQATHLFFQYPLPNDIGTNFQLELEEARHIKSMRLRQGDLIDLCDGKGKHLRAEIISPAVKACELKVLSVQQIPKGRDYRIHIAIAPTKSQDRIDWFVEKAIENGVDKISFIDTAHTERISMKSDRLLRKAI
ncbi:MAG: RsmE family RNA methyltransferase, partial [Bernardetiaceae bacterium]|nr:RsmE family RNA methyltransferase [Bernardetiaceae bacterium]